MQPDLLVQLALQEQLDLRVHKEFKEPLASLEQQDLKALKVFKESQEQPVLQDLMVHKEQLE